jgi:hypothetical protein
VHSESSNSRLTNKIHEALVDFAYQTHFGDDLVTAALFEQLRDSQNSNYKGIIVHLTLLLKLMTSFSV